MRSAQSRQSRPMEIAGREPAFAIPSDRPQQDEITRSVEALARLLQPAHTAAVERLRRREHFHLHFETELDRLQRRGRALEPREEEALLSALGAAAVHEYELASALVNDLRRRAPQPDRRDGRRVITPIATLRRRLAHLKVD